MFCARRRFFQFPLLLDPFSTKKKVAYWYQFAIGLYVRVPVFTIVTKTNTPKSVNSLMFQLVPINERNEGAPIRK